jgi:hypothetical protein
VRSVCVRTPKGFCLALFPLGTPKGFCEETEPGIFERRFTKAEVSINCNNFTANIKMTG